MLNQIYSLNPSNISVTKSFAENVEKLKSLGIPASNIIDIYIESQKYAKDIRSLMNPMRFIEARESKAEFSDIRFRQLERAYNDVVRNWSQLKPLSFIQQYEAYVAKSPNNTGIENGIVSQIFFRFTTMENNTLIVGPSPSFIVQQKKYHHQLTYTYFDDRYYEMCRYSEEKDSIKDFRHLGKQSFDRVLYFARDSTPEEIQHVLENIKSALKEQISTGIYILMPTMYLEKRHTKGELWNYLTENYTVFKIVLMPQSAVKAKTTKQCLLILQNQPTTKCKEILVQKTKMVKNKIEALEFRRVPYASFVDRDRTLSEMYITDHIDYSKPKRRQKPVEYKFTNEISIWVSITQKDRKYRPYYSHYNYPTADQARKNTLLRGKPIKTRIPGKWYDAKEEAFVSAEYVLQDKELAKQVRKAVIKQYLDENKPVSLKTLLFIHLEQISGVKGFRDELCNSVFFRPNSAADPICGLIPNIDEMNDLIEFLSAYIKDNALSETKADLFMKQMVILLDYAVIEQYYAYNPARKMLNSQGNISKQTAKLRKEMVGRSFDSEQEAEFLRLLINDDRNPEKALTTLVRYYTGLSLNQVCALTRGDCIVDPELNLMMIAITKEFQYSTLNAKPLPKEKRRLIPVVRPVADKVVNVMKSQCIQSKSAPLFAKPGNNKEPLTPRQLRDYYNGIIAFPGESYTFSAYVKTSEGAEAYLQIVDNVQVTVTSETLPGNSDWTRLEVTYTNQTSANRTMRVRLMTETAGTVYMDCVQLEKATTASRYNLIDNGDFGALTGWTVSSGAGTNIQRVTKSEPEDDKTILELDQLDNYAYQFVGNPQGQLHLVQDVTVSGNANDTFVLAGWAKGDSVPLTDDRKFCLRGVFTYTDGTTSEEEFEFSFNPDADSSVNWQYAAGMMRAKKAYTKITVYVVYDYNANTVLFDGIQLYKEEFGSSFTYDEETGNVTAVEDIQGQTTSYTYSTNNDLTQITLPDGTVTTYTYDDYHNVLTATSDTGVVTTYTYDTWGNNLTVSVGSGTSMITSSAAYSTDGNRLVSTTDTAGKVTQYSYHQDTNVLEWVQYPEDTETTRTAYTYDEMYRLTNTQVTTDQNSTLTASYTYADDLLTELETASTTYSFTYGDFSLRSGVYIGQRTLARYTYSEQNNFLERLDYGNGDCVEYEYDKQGRVTKQIYEDGDTVTYRYDNNGALASVTDSATGRTTTYYYDFTNRLMKYMETGDVSHSVQYTYDDQNKLTAMVEVINGVTQTTQYTYDDDQRLVGIQNGSKAISYTYDEYGRVSQKTDGIFTYVYTYKNTDAGMPSGQVATITVTGNSTHTTFRYTYDDNGNILSTYDSGLTNTYEYDSVGQLIRENNKRANKTWVWTYDDAGNILSKSEYAYTTGTLGTPTDTIVYTYGDESWGDLLTAYDGVSITYDEMGNPLSDGTWTYTWEHGRQLAAMSNGTTTWTYTYDANGMRTSRSNGTDTYSYVYNGSKLMQMTVGTNTLTFTYDGNGTPSTVTFNGTTYYYITNLQGDVVEIRNASGVLVCDYSYDAWGKLVSGQRYSSDPIALWNPLLYRGYVYDRDTGFYYLQSRYYDPAIGRFLNADVYTSTGQGLLGCNMFAYCNNNPVIHCDTSGTACAVSIGFESPILLPTTDPTSGGGSISTVIALIVLAAAMPESERRTKSNVIAITDARVSTTYDDGLYYGIDMRGKTWKTITDGMDFETAYAWVLTNAASGMFGKGASWGLYTKEQVDALLMILSLGGPGPCMHEKRIGEYPHYHPTGMILFGKYKHFHVWYGSIYGG